MVKLYGIKNCDTVKKAQKWLLDHNIAFELHDYRSDGLSLAMLETFAAQLDWTVMLNRNSTSWRQLDASQKSGLDLEKALHLMLAMPTLIKRPILAYNGTFLIGFKAGQYAAIFNIPATA